MAVLDIAALHIRPDVATLSGLFGVAGDDRVKLVDPEDVATMNRYHTLWRLHGSVMDADAARFFASTIPQHGMGPDTSELRTRVAQWRRDMVKVWIWHRWRRHRRRDHHGRPELQRDRVWLGEDTPADYYPDDPGPRFPPPPGFPGHTLSQPWGIDMEAREPNHENPWVQQTLEKMPTFHPMIMFRLCGRECHRPERERPRLRWAPPQRPGRGRGGGLVTRPRPRTPPWPPCWPPAAPEAEGSSSTPSPS